VWLSRDLRYDRPVALKVLRPDLSAALGADRFLREIRITAQLNHPHILPLLDSGEADGLLFYVMPFVAGGSLRERLVPGTALPLDAVLHVVTHVAAALDHALRHGVIHRDVKPENVLFSDGEPIVADFGIARAVTSAGGGRLTRTGFPLGTPGYMSPEQAAGGGRLDARTDVFGLGCVAYEMLVGGTPEMWPTEEATRLGRFVDASAAHRTSLDRLPGRVEHVLVRALAVRPDDRHPTPVAFAEALAAAAAGAPTLTEAQVHAVLQRAAELQSVQPTQDGALTAGAVEQIAAQVGIPPELVRQAMREVVAPVGPIELRVPAAARPRVPIRNQGPPGRFDRKTQTYLLEREAGREVTAAEHPALLREIQETLGIIGHVSAVGGGLVWSPATEGGGGRRVAVTITPAGGVTRILIEERLGLGWEKVFIPQAGAAIGAVLGVMMVGLGGIFGPVEGPVVLLPVALLAVLGAVSATRIYQTTLLDSRAPQLRELADRLEERVASGRPLLPGPSSGPSRG
jgi:hypothetical protein